MKNESIHFKIPLQARLKLEACAYKNEVTMSWIIRALITSYRNKFNGCMPLFKRPNNLPGRCVSFSLKLYGNKSEILTYARCNGGEFSPFIRYVLELWENSELEIDLECVKTIKTVKGSTLVFQGVAFVLQYNSEWYQKNEFWPKNRQNNLFLMKLGLSCRKHPLVA